MPGGARQAPSAGSFPTPAGTCFSADTASRSSQTSMRWGASSQLTACSKVPVFTHSRRDPEPWGTIFTTCLSQPARMPYSHTRLPPRKHRAYPRSVWGCTAMRAQAPSQGQREAPPLPSPRSRASHFGLLEQWLRVLQQLHYKSATELTCVQGLQSRCPTPSSGTEGVGGLS